MAGAKPVFADIDAATMNIDPREVLRAITPRTKAVIAVHLYGRMAPMDELRTICDQRSLRLIEDACQAHGAILNDRRAGTIGDAGCLSFYPTKNIGTIGEGGMVLTNDAAIAARVDSLRNHGQTERHVHVEPGFNYRMPELQAAALRVLLPQLDTWNSARIRAAEQYGRRLRGDTVDVPLAARNGEHVYHLYVVRTAERARLQKFLGERGIATAVHYPTPVHLQPAYATPAYARGSLPNTERATDEILSLPMHPHITSAEIGAVCDAIADYAHARSSAAAAAGGL
jgi:dTDP-4-amino-4,6-dideoxygalactose transaminase